MLLCRLVVCIRFVEILLGMLVVVVLPILGGMLMIFGCFGYLLLVMVG